MSGQTVLPRATGLVWRCLPFAALSATSLYRLLKLRAQVFVVEQACAFQDLDGLDVRCLHLLGESVASALPAENRSLPAHEEGVTLQRPGPRRFDADGAVQLLASARLVPPGVAFAEASIGRVVTAPVARGTGLGHALMAQALHQLEQRWGLQPVRIGAQAHLESFYNRHGFVSDHRPYIEDGIAHIEMLRK